MCNVNHFFYIYGDWKTGCRSALVYGYRWCYDFECRAVLLVQSNGSVNKNLLYRKKDKPVVKLLRIENIDAIEEQ